MNIPDHILEEQYLSALESYHRRLVEHVVWRKVKTDSQREKALHECAEHVRQMEASFPRLKNLRRQRESESSTAVPTEGLQEKFLLPDLRVKGAE